MQQTITEWCRIWTPPERATPSEWAGKHRILPPSVSAEPGPWRNNRTPYLVGLMDVVDEPGVEEAVFCKPVQIGGSEALRNCLGAWIDQDPGPCLIVMPDEQSAREAMSERIKPLLEESPNLRRHLSKRSWDTKATSITLDTMPIYVGWAGSPQRLASRPIRYVLLDELDKYPRFSGRDADPITLASERTTTYGHRAFRWKISTPTTRVGHIWQAWESCGDRRHYWVPCPECGEYQALVWSQVKWPELEDEGDQVKRADRIELGDLAWYECEHCQFHITDRHKPKMLVKGRWASEGQTVDKSGAVVGERPKSKRVGFHLNSIYSPWVRISAIVAEFLKAKGDLARMMAWRNNKLAEPFEEQASKTKPDTITAKLEHAGPPLVVPEWAGVVLASADVQKNTIYYVVRAWGHGSRSQLLAYGMVPSFDELRHVAFERPMPTAWGEAAYASYLSVDCRYRTDEVYKFASTDPARIFPVMGNPQPRAVQLAEHSVKAYPGVIRRSVNPNFWKDVLWGYVHDSDETKWLPHNAIADDYVRQMTSEHKIHDPKHNIWTWVPLSQGAANHLWDCETAQCMLAQLAGVDALPTKDELEQQHTRAVQQQSSKSTERANPLNYRGRW